MTIQAHTLPNEIINELERRMTIQAHTLPDEIFNKLERRMTIQAQIFLPDEIYNELERRAPQPENRSNLIAEALRVFFATHKNTDSELEQINQFAEELNQEAEDVLSYQVIN